MRTVSRPSENLAKQVLDIYVTAFRPAVRVPFPELLKAITDGKKTLFVAETTENLVGFAVVQRLACQTVYYLEYIAIAVSFRGRGVGRSPLGYLAQSVRSDQKAEGILFEVEPVDLASPQDRLVGERRLEFYRRSGAEIIKGARAYRMPNLTSQGSLPMTLMWLPLRTPHYVIPKRDLKGYVVCIYTEIYGRNPNDPLLLSILQDLSYQSKGDST